MANSTAKMGKLSAFSPPTKKDFNPETAKAWSTTVNKWVVGSKNASRSSQFFNPLDTEHELDQSGALITWTAFPALIGGGNLDVPERWQEADNRRGGDEGEQDEYCEWSVNRDSDGRLKDVTFVCEGPEYWDHFIKHQPKDAIAVIEQINGIQGVKLEEITIGGRYNKRNKYNKSTTGPIISLIHNASTLGAEIRIVADATVLRMKRDGTPVTDKRALIDCALFGVPGRNSDPEIGDRVNAIARSGDVSISLKDPIGLFLNSINRGNFKLNVTGDENDQELKPVPKEWFDSVRGDIWNGSGLRLKISNKTGLKATGSDQNNRLLDLGDIWDEQGNAFVKYGAQFADHIQIGVKGIVAPGKKAPMLNCVRNDPSALKAEGDSSVRVDDGGEDDTGYSHSRRL